MSYWIEVRCASQKANGCYSSRQVDTPMALTGNASLGAISSTIISISNQAKKLGWVCTTTGWICPKCFLLKSNSALNT